MTLYSNNNNFTDRKVGKTNYELLVICTPTNMNKIFNLYFFELISSPCYDSA